jgi:hypothetical protein
MCSTRVLLVLVAMTALVLMAPMVVLADRGADGATLQIERPLMEALLQAAERELGAQAELELGAMSISTYPLTGQTLLHAKAKDVRSGHTVVLSMDLAGSPVDGEAALQAELAATRARYGKLDPILYDALQTLPEGERLPVSIWVTMSSVLPPSEGPWFLMSARPDPETRLFSRATASAAAVQEATAYGQALLRPRVTHDEVRATLNAESARVQTKAAQAQAPLLTYLVDLGLAIDEASAYLPVIHATLSQAEIEALQVRDDVQSIGLRRPMENALDVAKLALYADYAWDEWYTGSGVRMSVIEVNGRAAVENPYLWGVLQDPQNACADTQSHPTAVTGMVRSRHVRYRGIAYGAEVRVGGACGGSMVDLYSATERALAWGARVFNNSWGRSDPKGQMSSDERYYDNMVWHHPSTVCVAAGNTGRTYADAYVSHPALAYNVISVGAYDDRNTATWSDDRMADFSSFRDPASAKGDREKPELCAPGVDINSTTTRSPWVAGTGNGTSYSSPMVAGTAAMIIQQRPELAGWPEAIKAILMASAVNNIEYDWKMEGRDGAGGIDTQEAVTKCAARRSWGAFWLWPHEFDANNDFYTPFYVDVADRARAVIVWAVDPNSADYPSRPQADLDLYWMVGGQEIDNSESWDNNFEVVGVYNVSPAGQRVLRVHAARKPSGPMRFAWAVHWWDE